MLVAGGNVTGSGNGGGLVQTFTFNRAPADPDEAMPDPDPQQFDDELYGWTRQGDMTYDRWYPTLTPLPDGRVLISGGASRTAGAHNTFEVYDPTTDTVELALDEQDDPIEFVPGNMPTYPFLFVLPNGDIFYAGGEGASAVASDGRVLIPDYNNGGSWAWDNQATRSAAMAMTWQPALSTSAR